MAWVLRLVLFGLAFVVALAWMLPLSFVMKRSGAAAHGLAWERVEGTLWTGRLTGLAYGAQPVGEARLSLQPMALFSGVLRYDVDWTGLPGRGRARVSIGRGHVEAEQVVVDLVLANLPGLAREVRESGGTASLVASRVRFEDGSCVMAQGEARTSALQTVGARYGRALPELSGPIRCEGGMLVLPLEGESDEGERIDLMVRVGLVEASSVKASVRGASEAVEMQLALMGFVFEDGAYIYRRQARLVGGNF